MQCNKRSAYVKSERQSVFMLPLYPAKCSPCEIRDTRKSVEIYEYEMQSNDEMLYIRTNDLWGEKINYVNQNLNQL